MFTDCISLFIQYLLTATKARLGFYMGLFWRLKHMVKVKEINLWSWLSTEKDQSDLKHKAECVYFISIQPKPQYLYIYRILIAMCLLG